MIKSSYSKAIFNCKSISHVQVIKRYKRGSRVIANDENANNFDLENVDNLPSTRNQLSPISEAQRRYGPKRMAKLTEWRLQRNARISRQANLPHQRSIIGLGPNDKPVIWKNTHGMESKAQIVADDLFMPAICHYIEHFPDKISMKYPKILQLYSQFKESKLVKTDPNSNELEKQLQFPHDLYANPTQELELITSEEPDNQIMDIEYEAYQKHHHLLQYMAKGLKQEPETYVEEIESWREQLWIRNYGSSDSSVPPSNIPCGGCGAHLHCVDPGIPGYIPSEKFTQFSDNELKTIPCQRCDYLQHFNVSLDVQVNTDDYKKIITEIKDRKVIVVLMVDLLDMPCSILPNIQEIIGANRIFVVANKVDLIPKDAPGYLERIETSVRQVFKNHVIGYGYNFHAKDVILTSAKTGYGVENLVTRLLEEHRKYKTDIYLVGCTNVGKSTLFNALLQSDLCSLREHDIIHRATTSLWPGTTLNLLKFPVRKIEGWQHQLRIERLLRAERYKTQERELNQTLYLQTRNPRYSLLTDRIGMTFRDDIPFSKESGHPFAQRKKRPMPFDPQDEAFKGANFFFDTPGTIYKDQIINLLTTEELLKTLPRVTIIPRVIAMKPFQTLFIGGLARIDLVHAMDSVWITVFASHYLPLHIMATEEASNFYRKALESNDLIVPNGNKERIKNWPLMIPKEFDFEGLDVFNSACDIVLSSVGWISICASSHQSGVIRAFTPEGRGLYLRSPSLVMHGHRLKGTRIIGTPCYEHVATDSIGDDGYETSIRKMLMHTQKEPRLPLNLELKEYIKPKVKKTWKNKIIFD